MADVTLKYHGDRVASGEMDADTVARSILAFGQLAGLITKTAYSAEAEVRTTLKGLRAGCFDVQFALYLTGAVADLINQHPVPLPVLIREVFDLYKKLGGEKASEVRSVEGDGSALVEIEDNHGNIFILNKPSFEVANTEIGARCVQAIIKAPLESVADRIEYVSDETEPLEINREEASYYSLPEAAPEEIEGPIVNEMITVLDIDGVMFRSGNKWRFYDGSDRFSATITDPNYISKVERREEAFASGDRLKVRLRVTDHLWPKRKREYEIVEVLEHRRPPRQRSFL